MLKTHREKNEVKNSRTRTAKEIRNAFGSYPCIPPCQRALVSSHPLEFGRPVPDQKYGCALENSISLKPAVLSFLTCPNKTYFKMAQVKRIPLEVNDLNKVFRNTRRKSSSVCLCKTRCHNAMLFPTSKSQESTPKCRYV